MTHAAGDALPPVDRRFTPVDLMAYGAATWDWYACHYDREEAARLGFPAPFVDGQNWGAVFAKQLRDHFGPDAFVSRMALRYHSMAFAGDRVTGSAEITRLRDVAGGRVAEVLHRLEKDGAPVASCRSEIRLPD
jgi:acyl dehydratase